MHPFLVSAAVVAIAELGDKTQLLALILAARFRKAGPILLGMLVADGIAVVIGEVAATRLPLRLIRAVAAVIFLLMAGLVLMGAGPPS